MPEDDAARIQDGADSTFIPNLPEPQDADVVLLDPTRDGLQQITEFLDSHKGLDAIHIISHGDACEITLGTTRLSGDNLAEHSAELRQWAEDVAPGAAQGTDGEQFITEVASLTGMDVAASTDRTGSAQYGGDWVLEANAGSIEAAALDMADAGWDGALPSGDGTVYFLGGYQLEQQLGSGQNRYWATSGFSASTSSGTMLAAAGHTGSYFNLSSISFTPSPLSYTNGVFQGNDINGVLTFKGTYVDNSSTSSSLGTTYTDVSLSLAGAISRVDQPQGRVASLYFWSISYQGSSITNAAHQEGLGFMLIVPGQTTGNYAAGGGYSTSANQGAVSAALNEVLTTQSGFSDAITAGADTAALYAGGTVNSSGAGVLANDSDATDGHTLTVVNVGPGISAPNDQVGTSIAGTYGHLTLNANGSYSYVADNASGVATGAQVTDTFSYQVSDGQGGFKTATLTFTVSGPGPLANADTGAVTQGSTLTGGGTGVLANDTDSTGAAMHVSGVVAGLPGSAPTGSVGSPLEGTYGHLTLNSDGSYSYVADKASNVSTTAVVTDTFTYAVTDANARTAFASLTVSVTPLLPSAPTVSWSATVSGIEGSPVSLGTLSATLGGGTLNTLVITGVPTGAVLADGQGNTHTSTGTGNAIDVKGWELSSLKVTPTNDLNFTLTATAAEKNAFGNTGPSATANEAVTVNPLAPTVNWTGTASGIEGSAISLNTLGVTVNSLTGDTNSLHSLTLSGAPTGTVISDGTRTATSDGTTPIDIKGWTLSALTVTPATAANFTLTATAQETDSEGNFSTTVTATEAVTVNPTTPTLSWAPTASGSKQTDVALGALTATITNMGGESNSWNTLTISGVPSGVVLADGQGGHSVTSTGATINVTGWTLSSLTVNSTTAQTFTLTATARESDAEGNLSTSVTTSEAVTISDASVPAPTVTWPGPVSAIEGGQVALPTLGYSVTGNGDSLNSLVITGAPAGTILADGQGHTHTSTGVNDAIDVSGWTLTALAVTPANAANFSLIASATERDGSNNISSATTTTVAVSVAPTAPTLTWSATASGVEGQSVSLGSLGNTITSLTGDTNSLNSLVLTGAPAGAVITDGNGHTHTSTGTNDAIDISGWTLTALAVTPANAANFTLTVTATERDSEGNASTSSTATKAITVAPTAPTMTWAATASGIEGQSMALGSLGNTITGLTGDANSLNSLVLTGAPTGTIITDGNGHTHTSTGINDAVGISGWTLTALAVTPANAANFTLTVTATERDAEGNTSTSATATKVVTVAPTAPTVSWSQTASGLVDANLSLGTLTAAVYDGLPSRDRLAEWGQALRARDLAELAGDIAVENSCLLHLLTKRVDAHKAGQAHTVGEWVKFASVRDMYGQSDQSAKDANDILRSYGMSVGPAPVDTKTGRERWPGMYLWVSYRHASLATIFDRRFPKRDNAVGFKGASWKGIFFDFNMTDDLHWIYQDFVERQYDRYGLHVQPAAMIETPHRSGNYILNPRAENLDNLPEGYYEDQIEGQDRWWIQRNVCNKWGANRNGEPVYPEFDEEFHVAPRNLDPVPGIELRIGMDAGLMAGGTIGQVMPNGQWRTIDEIIAPDGGWGAVRCAKALLDLLASERYREWRKKAGENWNKFIRGYGDPAAGARSAVDSEERTWGWLYSFLTASVTVRPCSSLLTLKQ